MSAKTHHPLKPSEVRKKATQLALKRWAPANNPPKPDLGEAYREGFEHGFAWGAAHAEKMIAKHGERG
jgi:hypothetical protein